MSVMCCKKCGEMIDTDCYPEGFCQRCDNFYCERCMEDIVEELKLTEEESEHAIEEGWCGYCEREFSKMIYEQERCAKEDAGDIEYHRRAEEPGGLK